MSRLTIARLETAARRPTTSTTWRIAKALRPRGTLHDQVALDERLRRAAGPSLVYAATRPHAARERVRGEMLAEAGGGPVVTGSDVFGAVLLAEIAAGAAGAEDGGHDD